MSKFFASNRAKIKQAAKELRDVKELGVDTETSSLDPHTLKLWSVQFGTEDFQVLVPVNNEAMLLCELGELLEDETIVKICHRATFDLKVLWSKGCRNIPNVYCTRTMEQIVTAGTFANTSLAGCLLRYFGVDMSKQERKDFYCDAEGKEVDKNGLITKFELSGYKWTQELQDYALMDVQYLVPLRRAQMEKLEKEDMRRLAEKIELPLVPITGLLEYRGVRLHAEQCKDFQLEMAGKARKLELDLIEEFDVAWKTYAMPVYKKNYDIYKKWADNHREIVKRTNKDRDPDNKKRISSGAKQERVASEEIKPFRTPPKPPGVINLNSVPQMRHALEQLGVHLPNMQKNTLEDAAGENPVLDEYLSFRRYEKLGQMAEIYEHINKVTQRVHQELNQNVDTGRFSAKNPNLMQTPAKAEEGKRFRSLFIASEGCDLIGADYAAIELAIIFIKSKDKKALHALNNNLDLHCWTMSHFLKCDYDSLVRLKDNKDKKEAEQKDYKAVLEARKRFEKIFDLPELKKCATDSPGLERWVKMFRDNVKTLTYGIAYGLSSFGLSRKFHCDPEVAQQFIDVFFSIYPGIKRWLDSLSDFTEKYGYSKTGSGRRRYYIRPRKPTDSDTEKELLRILKQQDRDPDSVSNDEWDELWEGVEKALYRQYRQTLGRIRRQGANQPIQGLSADITKRAMVLFEEWWAQYCTEQKIDKFKYGLVLTVHDELVADVPKKHTKKAAAKLKWAMEYSAKSLLGDSANIVVEPSISPFWQK